MHTKRIIPCLDVKNGEVVKGINFNKLKNVGDPVELAKFYNDEGADELVFLDITASNEEREIMKNVVKKTASEIFIPFTVGGGIRNIDDIREILRCGADKVSLNSSVVKNKSLIKEASNIFGSQCIVIAIDAKKREDNSGWNVFINGGRVDTKIDLLKWAKEITKLGAGEILLTSMDRDGTKKGFDLDMLKEVRKVTNLPIIASGGCGKIEHFKEVLEGDIADAALAASLFHYGELNIKEVKEFLKTEKIPVRRV